MIWTDDRQSLSSIDIVPPEIRESLAYQNFVPRLEHVNTQENVSYGLVKYSNAEYRAILHEDFSNSQYYNRGCTVEMAITSGIVVIVSIIPRNWKIAWKNVVYSE